MSEAPAPADSAEDDEIPVEAVGDLSPEVHADTPEYVLYGGKGGVGKTTMAAATGLASAQAGTETLVVSTDPAHSLADTLATTVASTPTRVGGDLPLYAVEIDPEDAVEEAGVFGTGGDLGGLEGLLGGPMQGDEQQLGAESLPGADEAAAMQQLLRFLDDDRFERVIIDTAPTGHTLRLLQLPEVLQGLVGTIARLRDRVSGVIEAMPGVEGDQRPDLDAIRDRVERLRAVLTDPTRTDFRVVMVPETMSIRESERLLAQLDDFGIPVGTLVINRVMEPFDEVVDLEGTGVDPDAFVAPNPGDCPFCEQRWDVQREALADATELFRGRHVRRVPLFGREVRGPAMLRAVAACLA